MTPERLETILNCLNQRQPDLTVIMENVVKPHNLAAVARTADAVGINEIHAITERPSIKLTQMAAAGVKKWVNIRAHQDVESCVSELKQQGFQIVATHLSDSTIDYRQVDYTLPTAILVGTELEGISDKAVELAEHCISVPMSGLVQSLNVSVATAIILYEAYHQKQRAGHYAQRKLDDASFKTLLFEWVHPQVANYCRNKKLPYPDINEQAELLEPVADSITYSEDSFIDWLKKNES